MLAVVDKANEVVEVFTKDFPDCLEVKVMARVHVPDTLCWIA